MKTMTSKVLMGFLVSSMVVLMVSPAAWADRPGFDGPGASRSNPGPAPRYDGRRDHDSHWSWSIGLASAWCLPYVYAYPVVTYPVVTYPAYTTYTYAYPAEPVVYTTTAYSYGYSYPAGYTSYVVSSPVTYTTSYVAVPVVPLSFNVRLNIR